MAFKAIKGNVGNKAKKAEWLLGQKPL